MGLGNPGSRYQGTRHNAGYQVVDLLIEAFQRSLYGRPFSPCYYAHIPGDSDTRPLMLLRWSGYMNNSGKLIPHLRRKYALQTSEFLVVVDNMDLLPGQCRLRKGGGNAGHNGLKSLIASFGSTDFSRLYIGVGRPGAKRPVIDHVLGYPDDEEKVLIDAGCLKAADALKQLRSESYERVAEVLNRR